MEKQNIPGILKIDYYLASLCNIPRLIANQTIDMTLLATAPTELEFIPETASLKAPVKNSDSGSFFQVALSFQIAGNDTSIINDLERNEYLYVAHDKSGNKLLIGSNQLPSFSFDMKNDSDASGGRSMLCKIVWPTSTYPIYVI